MIIGSCPYEDCDATLVNYEPEDGRPLPCFGKTGCDECNRIVWLLISRAAPQAYTQEEFDNQFEIDETTKKIRMKNDNPI